MPDQPRRTAAEEAHDIAVEAYTLLYPLVLMDLTRKQMTNVAEPKGTSAPINTFAHFREFPPLDFTAVVRPNFDTLYSLVWIDLTDGPMILSLPDSKGRYYLAPALSMWTDVIAAPGWRTTGTAAGDYAYVPPGWEGKLPDGVVRVESSTLYVWLVGRTATHGPDDYAAVHEFQDGMKLTPLKEWGNEWKPTPGAVDDSVDMSTAPLSQLQAMPAKEYFEYGARLMKLHPPKTTDYSQVWRMGRIGIVPGEDFPSGSRTADRIEQSVVEGQLEKARSAAYAKIKDHSYKLGRETNGWNLLLGTLGSYGIDYLQRAAVDLFGLGCNQLDDAYYPVLSKNIGPGKDAYVLHFDKDQIPPAAAFWSITLYDDDGFSVPNPLNRANLASWMDLSFNPDGSIDLYVSPTSPGKEKESNWLPAPSDKAWNITMRLYAPGAAAKDASWVPPALEKQSR